VEQSTVVRAEAGAELLYWDGWADGRTSSGERSVFSSIVNSLEVEWEGEVVFRERWRITGEAQQNPHPSGFQGACQWHLGLAAGPASVEELQTRVRDWQADGAHAECGELAPGVWLARVLAFRPHAG
jgi:urease accessory protein UreH